MHCILNTVLVSICRCLERDHIYEQWTTYSTDHLAQALGRAWGASITSVSAYKPHLALLVSSQKHSTYFDNVHAFTISMQHRKFCRETVQPEADFYPRFRLWLEGYDYCSPLTEEQVETITSEDEAHSYEPRTSPGSSPIRSPSNSPVV